MTTRTQQTNPRRWVLVFLAAIVAVAATVLAIASASAATTGVAETRVGAHTQTVDVLVEPPQHITAGQQLGDNAAEPRIVVATGVAANAGDDLTRVGRWMGDDELLKMQKSGQVQVGGGGTTHVADPANMSTYAKQAAPGSKYVEFDVPRTSLSPSGWPGGAQIPGPNHILARLAERRGSQVQFPVPACNIVVVGSC
ncbi:hypothetical protein KV100_12675 [Mumia sp. zg.B21]|uniref:TreTu family toxin n=1 Tax=Mumia sp. zg.B21 TaxID=2855447 RepID=UPI001C6EF8C7|nr:hypothetical protein [Mumia sp. zg.B21]MBW9210508.1 hypothetical protein [Mumia sp. zg.B21]